MEDIFHYWPNFFASTQRRARSFATNTILRSLSHIGPIYQWASKEKLDLVFGDQKI